MISKRLYGILAVFTCTIALAVGAVLFGLGSPDAGKVHANAGHATTPPTVSAGADHTLLVKDGKLYAWGNNGNGQLGLGNTTSYTTPQEVAMPSGPPAGTTWKTVAAGAHTSFGITSNGWLYAWGRNNYNQLGTGNTTQRTAPQRVGTGADWATVGAGTSHCLAIRGSGQLWVWGTNGNGELGNNTNVGFSGSTPNSLANPAQIITGTTNFVSVAAGNGHSLAMTATGTLYAWGRNYNGQVGNGSATISSPWCIPTPATISCPSGTWAKIAAGDNFSMGINNSGWLYAWGLNEFGQLGRGNTTQQTSPSRVGTATNWKEITAGGYHALATTTSNQLWASGRNDYGQLGRGNTTQANTISQVGSLTNWAAPSLGTTITAGHFHAVACNSLGEVYTWGLNNNGELGLGDTSTVSEPTRIGAATNWSTVAAGYYHSLAKRTDNQLHTFGANGGQLGLGNYEYQHTPTQEKSGASNWLTMAANGEHSLGIRGTTSGTLWSWGANGTGQLGQGDYSWRHTPTQVGSASNWTSVATGGGHSLAVNSSGQLWAWGRNDYGQVGSGSSSSTPTTSPVQITNPSRTWKEVYAGYEHSMAIDSTGRLYTWGRNNYGQLGMTGSSNRTVPTQVGSASDWIAASANTYHSLGIRGASSSATQGALWTWGRNSNGQLGINSTTDQDTPQQVGSDTNWTKVAAGTFHSLGIKGAGELWAWGSNGTRQLGNSNPANVLTPARIGSASNWTAIAASYHSLAVNSSGQMHSWGYNNGGQLGLGYDTNRNVPTLMDFFSPTSSPKAFINAQIASPRGSGSQVSSTTTTTTTHASAITFNANEGTVGTVIEFDAGTGFIFDNATAASLKIGSTNIGTAIQTSRPSSATTIAGTAGYRAWYKTSTNKQVVCLELDNIVHASFPSTNAMQVMATPSQVIFNISVDSTSLEGATAPTFNTNNTFTVTSTTFQLAAPTVNLPAGKTFANWRLDSATGGIITQIAPGDYSRNITLFATWNSNSYTVTFDRQGGSGSIPSQTIPHGGTVTQPSNTPNRTGYQFGGWYKEANCENVWTFGSGGDTVTGSTTIYAKWNPNDYTVVFHGNNNTGGTMTNQPFKYATAQNLNSNAFSRVYTVTFDFDGGSGDDTTPRDAVYTFYRWSRNQNGSGVTYNNGVSVNNLTSTNNGTIDLYAQWNEGSITLPAAAWGGRPFLGWYTAGNEYVGGSGESYVPKANIELVAKWDAPTYTVTYVSNGGTTVPVAFIAEGAKISPPAITRVGHKLEGWYKNSDLITGKWNFDTDTVTQQITLYAKWTINEYDVDFDLQDGTGTGYGTQSIKHGELVTKPADPTKPGHKFLGWFIKPQNPGSLVEGERYNFNQPVTEEITIYAVWEADLIRFTYTLLNGDPHIIRYVEFDTPDYQKPVNPERPNYEFDGWYTKNGYTNNGDWGNKYDFNAPMSDIEVTVFARWVADRGPLWSAITAMEEYIKPGDEKYYTETTYNNFINAIASAKITANDPNSDPGKTNGAITSLETAKNNLRYEMKWLTEIMDKNKDINRNEHTVVSYNLWIAALESAQAYINGTPKHSVANSKHYISVLDLAWKDLEINYDPSNEDAVKDKDDLFYWYDTLGGDNDDYIFDAGKGDYNNPEDLIDELIRLIDNLNLSEEGMFELLNKIIDEFNINWDKFKAQRDEIKKGVTKEEDYKASTWKNYTDADAALEVMFAPGSTATLDQIKDGLIKLQSARNALEFKDNNKGINPILVGAIGGGVVLLVAGLSVANRNKRKRAKA